MAEGRMGDDFDSSAASAIKVREMLSNPREVTKARWNESKKCDGDDDEESAKTRGGRKKIKSRGKFETAN